MSGKGNYSGSSMGGVEYTRSRKFKMRKQREAQEKRWAKKAGPVTIRQVGDPKPEGDSPKA